MDEYDKAYFYYVRDTKRRPIITVCVLVKDEEIVARGQAICSKKDNPCKRVGKEIALGRAKKALKTARHKFDEGTMFYKFFYKPVPSRIERRFIERRVSDG